MDRDTAVIGYENEGSPRIEGDHRTICKYESREAPTYQTMKDLLVHIVETKNTKAIFSAKYQWTMRTRQNIRQAPGPNLVLQ